MCHTPSTHMIYDVKSKFFRQFLTRTHASPEGKDAMKQKHKNDAAVIMNTFTAAPSTFASV